MVDVLWCDSCTSDLADRVIAWLHRQMQAVKGFRAKSPPRVIDQIAVSATIEHHLAVGMFDHVEEVRVLVAGRHVRRCVARRSVRELSAGVEGKQSHRRGHPILTNKHSLDLVACGYECQARPCESLTEPSRTVAGASMSVLFERDGAVASITIDRPEKLNAMDSTIYAELGQAFAELDADESLLVGILTGAGERAFSAGADLKY